MLGARRGGDNGPSIGHTDNISSNNNNSNNQKTPGKTQGIEYDSLLNFSLSNGGLGTSPGTWTLGDTYSSYHHNHLTSMLTQPLSCGTAASNSGTGVSGGGRRGGDTIPIFNINNCRLELKSYVNTKDNFLNIFEISQGIDVTRNIQFLSGCNPGHSGQLSRPNHSSIGESYSLHGGIPEHPVQTSNIKNNSIPFPHILYGEVRPIEYGIQGGGRPANSIIQ